TPSPRPRPAPWSLRCRLPNSPPTSERVTLGQFAIVNSERARERRPLRQPRQAKPRPAEAVAVVEHVRLPAMLMQAAVLDHLAIPPLGRSVDSCRLVEAAPSKAVGRLGVPESIGQLRIGSISREA